MSDLKPVTMYCCKGCQHLHHEIVTACDCGTGCEPFEYELWEARRTQPEATAPAQDLSAAILEKLVRYEPVAVQNNGYEWGVEMVSDKANEGRFVEFDDVRSLVKRASSANALSAGDRVDAERYRFLRDHGVPETDAEIEKALTVYQGIGQNSLLPDELDAAIDSAIQAQKDGHG